MKWVSDRNRVPELHAHRQRDERFLTSKPGFVDNGGGFKPKPNSNQTSTAIALPTHRAGGGSREAEGPQTTVTGNSEQLLNHLAEWRKHCRIHQRESRAALEPAGGTRSSLRCTRPCTRETRRDLRAEEERWGKTRGERRRPLPLQESLLQ